MIEHKELECYLEDRPWDDSLSDNMLLADDDLGQELPNKSWIKEIKIKKEAEIFVKRREKAIEELTGKFPGIGGCVHIMLVGMWDFWHIPETLLNQYESGTVKEIYLATWAFNRPTLLALRNQIERLKCKTTFIITKHNKRRYPGEHYLLMQTIQAYDGSFIELNQHSKVFLIDAEPNYFTIASSANMTKNEAMEQAILFNDKNTFDFYKGVFDSFEKKKIP